MKAVMISIQPKWVEKIVSGEKTIEVRKTAPKLRTPFKCYIYATKGGDRIVLKNNRVYELSKSLTGVVIGEFICDKIIELESEFWDDDTYESIGEVWYDEDDGERNVSIFVTNGCDDYKSNILCGKSCVSWEELRKYIGTGFHTFYALRISDLKIYDKPKEISEFWSMCKNKMGAIQRPPQSWCYVEQLKEKEKEND